jgi:hypothetical protein
MGRTVQEADEWAEQYIESLQKQQAEEMKENQNKSNNEKGI